MVKGRYLRGIAQARLDRWRSSPAREPPEVARKRAEGYLVIYWKGTMVAMRWDGRSDHKLSGSRRGQQ